MAVDGQYPVTLRLAGRRCLVVGGGVVAARKVDGLRDAGAVVTVVAPEMCPALEARTDVALARRAYRRGEVAGYWLAIAATNDPGTNRAAFLDGEAAGVWVNGADDPANCSFTLPSVLRRGDLTVAVSTGGRSPALARWVRRRLAEELGPEFEALLDLLADQRQAVLGQGGSTEDLNWDTAIDDELLQLVRAGEMTSARQRLAARLRSSSADQVSADQTSREATCPS